MILAGSLAVLILLLLFPAVCAQCAKDALIVWGMHVVPSLFPYMIFCKMLAAQLKNTSIPPVAVCIMLGMLGGSPSGAGMISSYAHRLSPKAICCLAALTGVVSPMFFLGSVSAWTGNKLLSQKLVVSQTIGSFSLSAILFHLPVEKFFTYNTVFHAHDQENSVLTQCIDAILRIGSCIICFSVVAGYMEILLPAIHPKFRAFLHGLLEISGGIHAMTNAFADSPVLDILLAFTAGFSGFSIIAQNLFFLKPLGVNLPLLSLISLSRAFLSAFCMALLNRMPLFQ